MPQHPAPGVITFSGEIEPADEAGYAAWRTAHPNGYVVNAYTVPTRRYLMLHRTDGCASIRRLRPGHERWTYYSKTCSDSRAALEGWARARLGREPDACKFCFGH